MLDLSEEFDEENISTCVKYFKRMTAINQWLEMEIGITGGEEDGVNNENVDQEKLYTSPQQVSQSYKISVFCVWAFIILIMFILPSGIRL